MNARLYDPVLGRFTAPDSIIQFPSSSQGLNRYSYVDNNPLSYTDPTGHLLGSIGHAFKGLLHGGKGLFSRFSRSVKQSVSRFTQKTLGKLSSVRYVGGLAATGYLSNPTFGSAYGWSTGDWKSVGRATATSAVLAAGVWAAPNLVALQWYGYPTFIGASAATAYASGYSIARINGASGAEASAAGLRGARMSAFGSSLMVGYQELAGDTALARQNSDVDVVGTMLEKSKPEMLDDALATRGSGFFSKAYWSEASRFEGGAFTQDAIQVPFVRATGWLHDWFTGTSPVGFAPNDAGFILRTASNDLLHAFTDLPIVGAMYNYGTMPIAYAWTVSAAAAEVNVIPALSSSSFMEY